MKYTLPCTQPATRQADPSEEMPIATPRCSLCGQNGHFPYACPDILDPDSKSSEQMIILAPRCSLCGNSDHLYYQCSDNVDSHTSDSEDEILEILKAPRNLYFEAQQKPESYFRQGIFDKDWLSNPSSQVDQHWSMADPRMVLFPMLTRKDATDDSKTPAPSTIGQLQQWKHSVARSLLDDLVSEAVHISRLRRFCAVRAALLSFGLEPALALRIYDLSRDAVCTSPSTWTLILFAQQEAAALQARQHALAGTSEAVPDALDHDNTADNSDSGGGFEPDWNDSDSFRACPDCWSPHPPMCPSCMESIVGPADSDSEFVPEWDDAADQDWGDTPVQDAPGYAGATETDCGLSDSAACAAVNAV